MIHEYTYSSVLVLLLTPTLGGLFTPLRGKVLPHRNETGTSQRFLGSSFCGVRGGSERAQWTECHSEFLKKDQKKERRKEEEGRKGGREGGRRKEERRRED